MEKTAALKEMIFGSKHLVVFTGAGISAESGIPTYRGDDGVWHKYDPAKYANVTNFFKEPEYYWSFFREVRYPLIGKAKPNKAHAMLASLEKKGLLRVVITQNIDGLHQLAGSERVLELHGNTRRITCLDCNTKYTMDEVNDLLETRMPPVCAACGGCLKPEVVFFGESLSPEVLDQAFQEARACDLFLVIGSSLVVQPAASLPRIAKDAGARLFIINKDPTHLDTAADLVFHDRATKVLGSIGSISP